MGWHVRKKSDHYQALQDYVDEISEMLGIESWSLMTDWFISKDKCLDKEACRIELAAEVDDFLSKIGAKTIENSFSSISDGLVRKVVTGEL